MGAGPARNEPRTSLQPSVPSNLIYLFAPPPCLKGNLARPGYMMSTSGMWPYSYNSCGGDLSGSEKEGANKPQKITACPDPSGFNRTLYGLLPGQGRGAPEIDIVEIK